MEAEKLAKQMIGFQKTAFNHTFDMLMAIRDHSEDLTCSWCEKNGILPEPSKKNMIEWGHSIKQSLEEYKKLINNGFMAIENCFDFSKMHVPSKASPSDEKIIETKQPEKEAPTTDEQ